jgi:alpha-1,6-mannosyltransferase
VLTGLSFGWVENLSNPAKVETWLSPSTALGRTVGSVVEVAGFGSADTALHLLRMGGTVATIVVVGWLVLTASRRTALQGLAVALLTLVALGPVVQPWYLLWALPFVAVCGLSTTQVRWAVGLSLGLSAYTVANTAATTTTLASLPEGIAALLAGAVVAAMLFVPRTTRALLLTAPRPQHAAALA